MLKEILSISGRPGLYKLISYGKSLIVVENLADKKRIPAHSRDKIISLGDIAIYTDETEVPLGEVFNSIYKKFEGKEVDKKAYTTPEQLNAFFESVLPNYDKERVYNNDIKKVITWYNILLNDGFTEFTEKSADKETSDSAE